MNGKFITLEGGEGAGKSTQLLLLSDFLKSKGYMVLTTREPGGSPGAELIRDMLVKGDVERWDPVTEMLLFNAARRDHLVNTIIPELDAGKWVICDRFADATLAYQGYGHGLPLLMLNRINKYVCESVIPDLTLIFDLAPQLGLGRAIARHDTSDDRFERMDLKFHERLRDGYRRIAQTDLNRYALIDASLEKEAVFEQIQSTLQQRLGVA